MTQHPDANPVAAMTPSQISSATCSPPWTNRAMGHAQTAATADTSTWDQASLPISPNTLASALREYKSAGQRHGDREPAQQRRGSSGEASPGGDSVLSQDHQSCSA